MEKLEKAMRCLTTYCLIHGDSVIKESIEILISEYDRILRDYEGLKATIDAEREDR